MADEKTFIGQLNSADTANDTDIMIIEGEETKKISFLSLFNAIKSKLALKTAAWLDVANNDTTINPGYVADARIVRDHGVEIDSVVEKTNELKEKTTNSALTTLYANSNGLTSYYVKNDMAVNLAINGSFTGNFAAWGSTGMGTLPTGCRPKAKQCVRLIDNFMLVIQTSGQIQI